MKTSTIGIVSTAILMAVAGVGFGIAQAAGNQSGIAAWTHQDQNAVEQYKDYLAGPMETGNLPEATPVAQSLRPDSIGENPEDQVIPQVAQSSEVRGPVETGAIPGMVPDRSWRNEYGND